MNEQQVLKNIFKEDGPVTWYGTVEARISKQRYKLSDSSDRIRYADCDPTSFYPKGAKVVVRDGRIIGGGQLSGNHRVYEV